MSTNTLKQIEKNVEELRIRCDRNYAQIKRMKDQGLRPAMYRDIELEISRIAGSIDTYTSCYQMIENQ